MKPFEMVKVKHRWVSVRESGGWGDAWVKGEVGEEIHVTTTTHKTQLHKETKSDYIIAVYLWEQNINLYIFFIYNFVRVLLMKGMEYSVPVNLSLHWRIVWGYRFFGWKLLKVYFFSELCGSILFCGEALCSIKDGVAATASVYKEERIDK